MTFKLIIINFNLHINHSFKKHRDTDFTSLQVMRIATWSDNLSKLPPPIISKYIYVKFPLTPQSLCNLYPFKFTPLYPPYEAMTVTPPPPPITMVF